jgi:hypothetical protein
LSHAKQQGYNLEDEPCTRSPKDQQLFQDTTSSGRRRLRNRETVIYRPELLYCDDNGYEMVSENKPLCRYPTNANGSRRKSRRNNSSLMPETSTSLLPSSNTTAEDDLGYTDMKTLLVPKTTVYCPELTRCRSLSEPVLSRFSSLEQLAAEMEKDNSLFEIEDDNVLFLEPEKEDDRRITHSDMIIRSHESSETLVSLDDIRNRSNSLKSDQLEIQTPGPLRNPSTDLDNDRHANSSPKNRRESHIGWRSRIGMRRRPRK